MALDTTLLHQARQAPTTPKFHLFPLLPPEIRIKIWKLNVQEPRVVTIKCVFVLGTTLKAKNSNPGALRVNREAREIALREGSFEFANILTKAVYFNFERDTLFFPRQYCFYHFFRSRTIPLPSVQNVIVARGQGRVRYISTEQICALTRRSDFKLKTLTLENCPKSRLGNIFLVQDQKERIMLMVCKSVKLSFISRAEMEELAASSP
jgi:hypothetical protein